MGSCSSEASSGFGLASLSSGGYALLRLDETRV
jgi:hypothetical protein